MTDHPLRQTVEDLPDGPGVYLWMDAKGAILYVGKARQLRSRVRSYLVPEAAGSAKGAMLRREIAGIETIVVTSEAEALLLENNLIKEYQPRFNVLLKDDKTYPWIVVTDESFPRIFATRRRDLPDARYFGPFTDVGEMHRLLALVRRMFTVRSCRDDLPRVRRERPCLDFHIGRCRAPCVGAESAVSYQAMIAEVVGFLEGRTVDLRTRIRAMMLEASGREDFERARDLRDTLRWLEQVETPTTVEVIGTGRADVVGYARDGDHAAVALMRVRDGRVIGREHRFAEQVEEAPDERILTAALLQWYRTLDGRVDRLVLPFPPEDPDEVAEALGGAQLHVPQRGIAARWLALADQNARHLLESLQLERFVVEERVEDPVYALGRALGMTTVPRRFICVDISTNQGRDTVGSLVLFEGGRPKKSGYRKFKISEGARQDDFAAIREVLTRYLRRCLEEAAPLPDLIVVDGGKGQLASAGEALAELSVDVPLISLAKRDEEVFLPGESLPLRLSRRSPELRLLQRARDEAHRFGLGYNRQRRAARTITSTLLTIPGVGESRRRQLLAAFGSLGGVQAASVAEIAALPGFSTTLAERVHQAVRGGRE